MLHPRPRAGLSSVALLALLLPAGFLGLLHWAADGGAPVPSPYLATLPSQGPDLLNDLDDTPPSTPLRDPCPAARSVAGAPGSGETASASPETDPCLPAVNVTMVPFDPKAPAVPCPNGMPLGPPFTPPAGGDGAADPLRPAAIPEFPSTTRSGAALGQDATMGGAPYTRARFLDSPYVKAASRELTLVESDLTVPTTGPGFGIARGWYSANALTRKGSLGAGWLTSLDALIEVREYSNGEATDIVLVDGASPARRLRGGVQVIPPQGNGVDPLQTWFQTPEGGSWLLFVDGGPVPSFERYDSDGTQSHYERKDTSGAEEVYYLTATSDPFGNTRRFTYSPASAMSASGYATQFVLTEVSDADGHRYVIEWDAVDPLITRVVIDPDGQGLGVAEVRYHYQVDSADPSNRLLDHVESASMWTEDGQGSGVLAPVEKYYRYSHTTLYGGAGLLLDQVLDHDQVGIVEWIYASDDWRVLTEFRGQQGAGLGEWKYSTGYNPTLGNYTRVESATGAFRDFFRDAKNRIVRLREYLDDQGQRFQDTLWEYDPNCGCSRVTRVTYPDGRVQEFDYDAKGFLVAAWTGSNNSVPHYRVERMSWSVFDPIQGEYFLRLQSYEPPRDAYGTEAPGSQCSDPSCGGEETLPGHLKYTFQYDPVNGALTLADFGAVQASIDGTMVSRSTEYSYHPNGLIAERMRYEDALQVEKLATVVPSGGVRPQSVTLEDLVLGNSWTTVYGYDSLGQVATVTGPDGVTIRYSWSPRGQVYRIEEDWNGTSGTARRTTESRSDPRGRPWKQLLFGAGIVGTQEVRLSYDQADRLVLVERSGLGGALEKAIEYLYTVDHRIEKTLEWGHRASGIGPLTIGVEYPSVAEQGVLRLPQRIFRQQGTAQEDIWQLGTNASDWAYDAMGRLLRWRDAGGVQRYQSYDSHGRPNGSYRQVAANKYLGRQSKYDQHGYIKEVEIGGILGTPDNQTGHWWDQHRKYSRNEDGNVLVAEVFEGLQGAPASSPSRRVEYTLDGLGRAVERRSYHGTGIAPLVQQSWVVYDALGRVVQNGIVDDPVAGTSVGVVDTLWEDAARKVTTVVTSGTYQEKSWILLDSLGRPFQRTQAEWTGSGFGAERSWQTSYDGLDRVIQQVDPLGVGREWVYDDRGRVVEERRTANDASPDQVTQYLYDDGSTGALASVVDPTGSITSFTYHMEDGGFWRPQRTTHADGRWEEITAYDGFGRTLQTLDSRGVQHDLSWSYGRRTEDLATWTDVNIVGPSRLSWIHDDENHTLTSQVHEDLGTGEVQVWETRRVYDWLGLLVQEDQGLGADLHSWSYQYGGGGELRKVVYPAGFGLGNGTFSYLADGRLDRAHYKNGATTVADVRFGYDGLRSSGRQDLAADLRLTSAFDGWGHRVQLTWQHDSGSGWGDLEGQDRVFDQADRVIARQRLLDNIGEVFEHDGFGRMAAWYQGVPSALAHTPGSAPAAWAEVESYNLDPVFGRQTVIRQVNGQSVQTESYTSDPAHFYTGVPDGQGGSQGRTSSDGLLSDDTVHRFRYDAWGRLTEVERKADSKVIRRHHYDAEGRRVRTVDTAGVGAVTTRLLWWGEGLAATYEEGGSQANIRSYGYTGGPDGEAFVVVEQAGPANGSYELARDFQGSVLALIDRAGGSVAERYGYTPFGAVTVLESNTPTGNDRFFLGRPYDAVTGHHDLRARWYDADTGAFLSPDPLGAIDSWNLYQYGFAAPGFWMDPTGKQHTDQEFERGWERRKQLDAARRGVPKDVYTRITLADGSVAKIDLVDIGGGPDDAYWTFMRTYVWGGAKFATESYVAGKICISLFHGGRWLLKSIQARKAAKKAEMAKKGAESALEAAGDVYDAARGVTATAKELNQVAHLFPRAEKGLEGLVRASGGSELNALRAVQSAANQALAEGRLVAGANGVLPGNGLGAVLEVNGVKVQLIGGRIMNGVVELGSFVGR